MGNNKKENEFKDIRKLEEEFSNFFEDLMYDRGGSPLLGRIFALCILTSAQKPLLQKDLVDKFQVNPSTISRNLKELENWGLLDRRREPGSREWKYQVEPTSFLELLVNKFEENAEMLKDREDALKRIRTHWGSTLSKESKETKEGKRTLQILDFLIEWITIVEDELDIFIQTIHKRFLEMEKQNERFSELF
jgi:DNA-binding transcriptional regulator GbsR (MarR family)